VPAEPRDATDCQRHRRVRHIENHVDALTLEPLARDVGADVGLVLVIGEGDLDLELRV
jgi:hypothetical protein